MRKSWCKNHTKQNHCNSQKALDSKILREGISIWNKYDNCSGFNKLVYLRAQWHVSKYICKIQHQKKFNTNPKYLMGKWLSIVIDSISHNIIRSYPSSGGFMFQKQSSRKVWGGDDWVGDFDFVEIQSKYCLYIWNSFFN